MGTKATVVVAGAKGGVGKTTSLNLAALLATKGETVVVGFEIARDLTSQRASRPTASRAAADGGESVDRP